MNISSDTGGIDSSAFLDYIAKQFPSDLTQMVTLRDELEKRQGAMIAVNAANNKVIEADAYAESTKAQADALLNDAKINNAASKDTKTALDAREKDLIEAEKQSSIDNAATAKALATKEAELIARENGLSQAQASLAEGQAKLVSDQNALETRIKALQDKVASISI
jgi:hypothetical protein